MKWKTLFLINSFACLLLAVINNLDPYFFLLCIGNVLGLILVEE
jgi:uncharacterized membrane protein